MESRRAFSVLGELRTATYAITPKPPNVLDPEVEKIQQRWRDLPSGNEEAAEDWYDRSESLRRDDCVEDREAHCRALVKSWIQPLVDELDRRFAAELGDKEAWAFELGKRLDQGVRRKDVYRWMHREPELDLESLDTYEVGGDTDDEQDENPLANYSPKAGELSPEKCWWEDVITLCGKSGIPGADSRDFLTVPGGAGQEEVLQAVAQAVDDLDQRIREVLIEVDPPPKPGYLGLVFNEKTRVISRKDYETRDWPVCLTRPLLCELLKIFLRSGARPSSYDELREAWNAIFKPVPKVDGRVVTEVNKLKSHLEMLGVTIENDEKEQTYVLADSAEVDS
jgi:hypothetical protein